MARISRSVSLWPTSIANVTVRDYALTALLVLEGSTLFVAAPLAGMGFRPPLLIGGCLAVPLALAIVIVSPSIGGRLLAVTAAAFAISGAAFRISHPSIESIWLGHAAVIAAFFAITWVIGTAVFAPGRVTHHRIEGAVLIYFNIAIIFTSAYRMIAELDPKAFGNLPVQSEAVAVSGMLYFSFTTLTSTGFGEIVPIHPIARSLSNLEAVLGQLYLTILLARLVTMHIGSRSK